MKKSNIKNLTVERLRKFKGETIFYDWDGIPYTVDDLFEILEQPEFDNDYERNIWLEKKFSNVIEDQPVPFGKGLGIEQLASLWRRAENKLLDDEQEDAIQLKEAFMEDYKKLTKKEQKQVDQMIEGYGG